MFFVILSSFAFRLFYFYFPFLCFSCFRVCVGVFSCLFCFVFCVSVFNFLFYYFCVLCRMYSFPYTTDLVCDICGGAHYTVYCSRRKSYATSPNCFGNLHRNEPHPTSSFSCSYIPSCVWCGEGHFSHTCPLKNVEPTDFNSTFCRNRSYNSFPHPGYGCSSYNQETWPTEWELHGDNQGPGHHHYLPRGCPQRYNNQTFSQRDPEEEVLLQLQNTIQWLQQAVDSWEMTPPPSYPVLQRPTPTLDEPIDLNTIPLGELQPYFFQRRKQWLQSLEEEQSSLVECERIIEDGWSTMEKKEEEVQAQVELPQELEVYNDKGTLPELGMDENTDQEVELDMLTDTDEAFKDSPEEDFTMEVSIPDLLDTSLIEKWDVELAMEAQASLLSSKLELHKGSFFIPTFDFIPLSPYLESIIVEPPYILPMIVNFDSNGFWEFVVYGLLTLLFSVQAPILKACKDDVHNLQKDITFSFDRG